MHYCLLFHPYEYKGKNENTRFSRVLFFLLLGCFAPKPIMAGITAIEQYVIDTVRKMRQEAGLSQVDIAVLLETSEGFIGDIESTSRNAKYSIRHLNELAKIFKCSPRDFLPENPI